MIRGKRILLPFLFVSLLSCLLAAQENKPNLAVMDFSGKNVSAIDASVFSDILRTEIVNQNTVNVVDKANMDKILSEAAFQQTGCTSSECAAQVGKILNVQKMIVGSLSKIEGTYCANANYVDVETGKIERSETVTCDKVKEFYTAANDLAKRLVGEGEDRRAKHGMNWDWLGVGVGNPYVSLIFNVSKKLSIEPRYAAGDTITAGGLRINYTFKSDRKIDLYTALEYYSITFNGLDRIDNGVEIYKSTSGQMAGIYFGGIYKFSRKFGFCLDIGPSYIVLGQNTQVSGIEFVVNTGFKFMF